MSNEHETNWTNQEFLAYLFIYCSKADFEQNEDEIGPIKEKYSVETFNKMQKEQSKDSDYSSIQKITNSYHRLGYSEKREELLTSIKKMFFADGEYGTLERNMMMNLKRILD